MAGSSLFKYCSGTEFRFRTGAVWLLLSALQLFSNGTRKNCLVLWCKLTEICSNCRKTWGGVQTALKISFTFLDLSWILESFIVKQYLKWVLNLWHKCCCDYRYTCLLNTLIGWQQTNHLGQWSLSPFLNNLLVLVNWRKRQRIDGNH